MIGRGQRITDPTSIATGEIVAVRISGVWHEGIADEQRDAHGAPLIWNKSKRTGRVEREPWERFAGDLPTIRIGYPGQLEPAEVLARARAREGEEWTPIHNCQRFTRACHGVPSTTPELDALGVACLIAMVGGPLP